MPKNNVTQVNCVTLFLGIIVFREFLAACLLSVILLML